MWVIPTSSLVSVTEDTQRRSCQITGIRYLLRKYSLQKAHFKSNFRCPERAQMSSTPPAIILCSTHVHVYCMEMWMEYLDVKYAHLLFKCYKTIGYYMPVSICIEYCLWQWNKDDLGKKAIESLCQLEAHFIVILSSTFYKETHFI